jgi:hypothetical protein
MLIVPDFDESTHTYRVDGEKKPSTTQILDFMGHVSPFAKSDTHADRGTRIHRITQLYDLGQLHYDFLNDDELYSIEYYVNFLNDFRPKWNGVETLFYNPELDHCGQVDRWNDDLLVDIKTGTVPKSARLQTASYALGVCDKPEKVERFCLIINPKKHKTYKISKPYTDPVDFLEWKQVVKDYRRMIDEHDGSN